MVNFSIITVTYNVSSTISATIESVLKQTYGDWEYIFIDGGSLDGTVDIIKSYVKEIRERGHNTIFLTEPDEGIYDAMNKGASIASGKWISFLNSGDIFINEEVLEKVASRAREFTGGVIYGNSITSTGNRFTTRPAWMLPYKKPFYHQAAFILGELQKKYRFDLRYNICADFDLFQRVYLDGNKYLRINTIIVKSDDKGVSKDPRNREKVITQDMEIIKKNGIRWYNHPLIIYFNRKREKELLRLKEQRK